MQLVVDANILFSALIKDSETRFLLLNTKLELFSPEFLLNEVKKHILSDGKVREKILLSDSEISEIISVLLAKIKVLDKESYSNFLNESLRLIEDEKDAPYLALSIKLCVPLWSEDKGFKKQFKVKVFSSSELFKELSK